MEADPTLPTDPKPDEWPLKGLVEFDDVQLRYRDNLPLVLRNLSFTIKAGEKVGIIGRTGAGKSSIAQALFRAVELAGGSIKVDGVDLKTVGLDVVSSGIILCTLLTVAGEESSRDHSTRRLSLCRDGPVSLSKGIQYSADLAQRER